MCKLKHVYSNQPLSKREKYSKLTVTAAVITMMIRMIAVIMIILMILLIIVEIRMMKTTLIMITKVMILMMTLPSAIDQSENDIADNEEKNDDVRKDKQHAFGPVFGFQDAAFCLQRLATGIRHATFRRSAFDIRPVQL